jgi:hypothetical protein
MTASTRNNPAITFQVTFHGPFRVATGHATGRGADSGVDQLQPLPAESLKGLMRASARILLGCTLTAEHPLVGKVFGVAARPSPWGWTSAVPISGSWPQPALSARVRIDPQTHAAVEDYLATVEQVWPVQAATFDVEPVGLIPPGEADGHRLLLRAAASGVHAVGADRRRGLGWVTVTCPDHALTDADIGRLYELRSTRA